MWLLDAMDGCAANVRSLNDRRRNDFRFPAQAGRVSVGWHEGERKLAAQVSIDLFHHDALFTTMHCVVGRSMTGSGLSAKNSVKAASTPANRP